MFGFGLKGKNFLLVSPAFFFPNYRMVVKHTSPKILVSKRMHRDKGRSTGPDMRAEGVYVLLCNIFCT